MHAEIAKGRNEIAAPCRKHRVSRFEIFVSAARGTDFDPASSDANLLVELDPSGGSGDLRWHFAFQAKTVGAEIEP